jgi:hypothetical protein
VTTDASCGRAFVLLKALVAQWLHDYKNRNDLHAYSLLLNCYRYLCGGSGNNTLLSDPTVHRIIYGLMIKLFKRLIVELKKLSVNIVYASFSKLIVSATGKHDIAAAEEYVSFIVDTVLRKELFQNLEIRIRGYWNQLFWYNANNWCGGRYPADSTSTAPEQQAGSSGTEMEVEAGAAEEDQGLHVQSMAGPERESPEGSGDEADDVEAATQLSASPARLPPSEVQLSGFSKAATQARWQESKLFSMWAKQSQGDSQPRGDFVSSVALSGAPKERRQGKSGGKRRGKRAGAGEVNMLADSDDEEAAGRHEEYNWMDELEQTPAKNTRSGGRASELDRDHYSDDEEGYSSDEPEPDIKQYGGGSQKARGGSRGRGRRSMSGALDSDDDFEPAPLGSRAGAVRPEEEEEETQEEASPHDFHVEHHWSMTSHLPQPVVVFFEWVVAEYMKEFQRAYEDLSCEPEREGAAAAAESGVLVAPHGREHGHGAARHRLRLLGADRESVVEKVQEQMRSVLTVTLLTDMLAIMDQLRELYGPPGGESARAAFDYSHTSLPAGDAALFTDPVLEYVKVCLAVICLDASLPDEIAALRRGLLSQLKIREFSAQSDFVDYNASYILSDVICNYCNNCRYALLALLCLHAAWFCMLLVFACFSC